MEKKIFAPILDIQKSIRCLVNLDSKSVSKNDFSAFGEKIKSNSNHFNPWGFVSKRIDPELNLIFFGKRYYDPEFGRWLTQDPAGFVDSVNLYQFVLNNPYRYIDPDGQFAFAIPLLLWGAELIFPSLSAIVTPIIYGAITGIVAYEGYKFVEKQQSYSQAKISEDLIEQIEEDVDTKAEKEEKKKKPRGKQEGAPIPNTAQIKQADGAKKEAERIEGKKMSDDLEEIFHDDVTKQNYTYKQLVEVAQEILRGERY